MARTWTPKLAVWGGAWRLTILVVFAWGGVGNLVEQSKYWPGSGRAPIAISGVAWTLAIAIGLAVVIGTLLLGFEFVVSRIAPYAFTWVNAVSAYFVGALVSIAVLLWVLPAFV